MWQFQTQYTSESLPFSFPSFFPLYKNLQPICTKQLRCHPKVPQAESWLFLSFAFKVTSPSNFLYVCSLFSNLFYGDIFRELSDLFLTFESQLYVELLKNLLMVNGEIILRLKYLR